MKRLLPILVALFCAQAEADIYQATYGVQETFDFWLYNADGTFDIDEADGGTEVSIACNEGAQTTATNDFVDEGSFYSITLTAAEIQCERAVVVIAATIVGGFIIQTYGHASAMTVNLPAVVNSVATGAIDAAAIAADAIGASEIAADAIGASEIANNAIDAASTAADFSTEKQDADIESVQEIAVCAPGDGGGVVGECP